MSVDLLNWMEVWPSLSVLVLGEAMLDSYLHGHADRLCREAPAPVVAVHQQQDAPGGAANTAANVTSLGARATLLSVLGGDAAGDRLYHTLQQRGMATEGLIRSQGRSTLAKQRVVANGQILLRLDQGSTEAIAPDLEQALVDRLVSQFPQADAVIVSDYGYGILTPRLIQTLADLNARSPRPLLLDSRRLGDYRAVGATVVKPNYNEAIQLLGLPCQTHARAEQMAPHGDRLLTLTGAAIAAVTLDREGAIVFERGQAPGRMMARPAPPHQTSGAGDTFISALALAIAAGAPTSIAATLASAATAIVVHQPGTTCCAQSQLRRSLQPPASHKVIHQATDLVTQVLQYRSMGRRIILTNGCFDLLHPGHVTYLAQARSLGDVLIVGVNSDASVRQLKGRERPVNPLSDRLTVLSALSCVDHVVPFDDLTPHALIRQIRPDIFVKGGDYRRDTLPEAELVESLGGSVRILPYLHTPSTTQRIQQIQAAPDLPRSDLPIHPLPLP